MISESLKINTTLTKLNLNDDYEINKTKYKKKMGNEIDNEQVTLLEMKEPK